MADQQRPGALIDTLARTGECKSHEAHQREIEDRIARRAGQLNTVQGAIVMDVAEAIEHRLWAGVGFRSVEHWLSLQLGIGLAGARRYVRVAERVAELPHSIAALTRGEMTLAQADVIASAPARVDHDLAELARVCTVDQLRLIVNQHVIEEAPTVALPNGEDDNGGDDDDAAVEDVSDPQPAAAADPVETTREFLSLNQRDDGQWSLTGRLDVDHGLLLNAALGEVRDALFQDGEHGVTTVDALMELATTRLETLPDHARRDRYRVYLHLRGHPHADGSITPTMTGIHGEPLPPWFASLLCCDAQLSPLLHDPHSGSTFPVAIGRSQRTVPSHLRRLIIERDGGCRVPGCGSRRYLDVHHLRYWSHGGPTDPSNLIAVCRRHHRAHHRGELTFRGDPDDRLGFRVLNQHGIEIGHREPVVDVEPAPLAAKRYRHPLGERLDRRWIALGRAHHRPCCIDPPAPLHHPPPQRRAERTPDPSPDDSDDDGA